MFWHEKTIIDGYGKRLIDSLLIFAVYLVKRVSNEYRKHPTSDPDNRMVCPK
jgi:hypothetical protein